MFFGAGYGNRTRLHGLGSRCITDIRTLHSIDGIIADPNENFNTFLSSKFHFLAHRNILSSKNTNFHKKSTLEINNICFFFISVIT